MEEICGSEPCPKWFTLRTASSQPALSWKQHVGPGPDLPGSRLCVLTRGHSVGHLQPVFHCAHPGSSWPPRETESPSLHLPAAGDMETHHGICSRLCKESDSVVLAVGYRQLPKHKFPVPIRDCLVATIHFLKSLDAYGVDPARVVVCGDSLGGGIATVVCQKLVDRPDLPQIRAQILIYASLQALDLQTPSFQQSRNIPLLNWSFACCCFPRYLDFSSSWQEVIMKGAHLPAKVWEKYRKWLGPENIPERFKKRGYRPIPPEPVNEAAYLEVSVVLDVMCSPLIAEDDVVSQLPETCIVSCEYDALRDDSLLYKKRLEDLGVPMTWRHMKDGFHGVLTTIDMSFFHFPCSTRILNVLVHFIKGL
ncbi:arylacetamide deacetylase-like 3 isoform X2 [Macaca nemestrina]|uniref:arylacetamide deacetylase-like 3 isoform X2 n=1 Tax=Macaca nemestrina TaxID=9545 RepID=UPI0039B8AAFB